MKRWFLAVFRGFNVFLGSKVKFHNFKIFKIGQKFDFHKMALKCYQMSSGRRKWVFEPPKAFFCQYIMILTHLSTLKNFRFLGSKSKISWFSMLHIMTHCLVRGDEIFEKSTEMCSRKPLDTSKYLGWCYLIIRSEKNLHQQICILADFPFSGPRTSWTAKKIEFLAFFGCLIFWLLLGRRWWKFWNKCLNVF